MKFHNILEDVLGSQARIKILRALTGSPKSEFTSREVAGLSDVSLPQTLEILGSLEDLGLVQSRVIGRSIVWAVNRDSHLLNDVFLPLFEKEKGLLDEIKARLADEIWNVSEQITIFGSAARGEESYESDLDVFVLVRDEKAKKKVEEAIAGLQKEMIDRFNTVLSPIVYTEKEMKEKRGSSLLKEIEKCA